MVQIVHKRFGVDDSEWDVNWWAIAAAGVMVIVPFIPLLWPQFFERIAPSRRSRRNRKNRGHQAASSVRFIKHKRGEAVMPVVYIIGWALFSVAITHTEECAHTSIALQLIMLATAVVMLSITYFFKPRYHSNSTQVRDAGMVLLTAIALAILITDIGFARSHPWNFLAWLFFPVAHVSLSVARAIKQQYMKADHEAGWTVLVFIFAQLWNITAWGSTAVLMSRTCRTVLGG